MSHQFPRYHGEGDRASPSVGGKGGAQGGNRFRGRAGSGDSGFSGKYSEFSGNSTPPTSPTSATQTNNLIDYVVETLCFGEAPFSFDMNFKALTQQQTTTQLSLGADQSLRVEKTFGPKRFPGPRHQAAVYGLTSDAGPPASAPAAAPQQAMKQPAPSAPTAPNGGGEDGHAALRQAIEKLSTRKEPHERTAAAIQKLSDVVLLEEKRVLKQGLRSFDVLFEKVTGRLPEKADKEPLRTVYAYYKELKKEIGVRGANHPTLAFQAAMDDKEDADKGGATGSSPLLGRHGSGGHSNFSRMPAAPTNLAPPQPQPGAYGKPGHANGGASPNNGQDRSGMYLDAVPQQQPNAAPKQPPAPTVPTNLPPSEIEKLRAEKKVIKRKLFDFMSQFKEMHGREVKTKEDRQPFAAEYDRYRHLKQVLQAHDNATD